MKDVEVNGRVIMLCVVLPNRRPLGDKALLSPGTVFLLAVMFT
jgi:hypothetical protein